MDEVMYGEMLSAKTDMFINEPPVNASRKLNVVPATILYRIRTKNYPTYEYYDI